MYKGSLFERLNKDLENKEFSSYEESLYTSIANNITRILSTNAGSTQTASDYGMPDLNNINLSMKDLMETIETLSEKSIRKYEPRLLHTQVYISREKLLYNEMNIFIEGYVVVNNESKRINFKANLLKNGKVKIFKNGI